MSSIYKIALKIALTSCALCLLLFGAHKASANTTTSVITSEVTSGDLLMTAPNNLSFSAQLTGQKQSKVLDLIETTVTDYRGISDSWQLTVSSPNFESYNKNYQLLINDQYVSKSQNIIYKNDKPIVLKTIGLPVKVEISDHAVAGFYGANLEWNLQPNIKNLIKE